MLESPARSIGERLAQDLSVVCDVDEKDVSAILACSSESFAPVRASYTREAFAATVLDETSLMARLSSMRVLVGQAEGVVVGTMPARDSTRGVPKAEHSLGNRRSMASGMLAAS